MHPSLSPVIKVKNLAIRLQKGRSSSTLIEGVHFDVYKGQTLAIVGESGCGKTLIGLSILGLVNHAPFLPVEGEILFYEKNLLSLSENQMRMIRGKKIGMIFQDPLSALNPVCRVGDQLIEAARYHLGLHRSAAKEKGMALLQELNFPDVCQKWTAYPHELSGGMRQRVLIALGLIGEPDLLIADEPTTALDVVSQRHVLQSIREIQQKRNLAIILMTHDKDSISQFADDVLDLFEVE